MDAVDESAAPRHELNFDHHSDWFRDDNKAAVRWLHESGCPLAHSTYYGGYWLIYGYEAVYDAAHNTDLFSSRHAPGEPKGVPPSAQPYPLIPNDFDGRAVQEYRQVVLGWFSPGGAKRDEPLIRGLTGKLIDDFIERGHCDLSQQLLIPVPARLILELLGWDAEGWADWIECIDSVVHDRANHPERASRAATRISEMITVEIERRRSGGLSDDLFSDIMRAQPQGAALTDDELRGYAFLLLLGAMDSTAGLTGNTLVELSRHSDLRHQIIGDPSLLPKATEEFLRHSSPSYGLYRTIARDAVFYGQQLRAGDRAVLLFPAAGLDPAVFTDPEKIDFTRENNRHMAFGLGVHRCLGSHHARVMFQVIVGEVLRRMPDYYLSGEPVRFDDAGDVYAIRNLPVSFTPGVREG